MRCSCVVGDRLGGEAVVGAGVVEELFGVDVHGGGRAAASIVAMANSCAATAARAAKGFVGSVRGR